MRSKTILAIFIFTMLICLCFLSEMIVYAEINYAYSSENARASKDHSLQAVTEQIPEPVTTSAYEKSTVAVSGIGSYDKNINIEILAGGSCTNTTLYDYLIMVVMSEMPYTFEMEALKAQAVAARSYTLRQFTDESRHKGYTVCRDPSHCSAGLDREAYIDKYGMEAYEKAYKRVCEAVSKTDGEVIEYNGELCCAVYHSSSYKTTENSYNLWGTETPYLVSVTTPEESSVQTVSISPGKLGAKSADSIKVNRNDTGRCENIIVGDRVIKAGKIRSALGLKSSNFEVKRDGENLVFTVYGYGHGIGMSQYGANEMAKFGKTYSDILTHYYTGVEIVKQI